MLGGSVASAVILGAPDLAVMTLSELAEQVRRITRASNVSLIVDADHGYGNALSVIRTVQELEAAGCSGLTIEDTSLPAVFDSQGQETLISLDELLAKLRSAVAARQDPETVIIGRTGALRSGGIPGMVERVRAIAGAGVDAIFVLGVKTLEELEALGEAAALPVMVGNTPAELTTEMLSSNGIRIALRGHLTLQAMVKGIYDVLTHQAAGQDPAEISSILAKGDLMNVATGTDDYKRWEQAFLA
jgi:carboxyvinyl-carboxyphosphonate phosphorylmutase